MKKKIIPLITFLLMFVVTALAENDDLNIKSITGTTLDGKQIKLSDFEGKIILLDFWASWCPPCREEFPELIKFSRKHEKEDFVIIAVNIDDQSANVSKFLDKLYPKPNFPIIWDSEKKIPSEFDIVAMPTTIMIDKTGKERFRHNGFKLSYIQQFEEELKTLNK